MIGKRAAERFGGDRKPAGCAEVGAARPRIPAGVVVGEQDGGAAVTRRIEDDRAQREPDTP